MTHNLLRQSVKALLDSANTTAKVCYQNIPKPVTYPYIVFDIQEVTHGEAGVSCTLDLDVVSRSLYNTIALADTVQAILDHATHHDTNGYYEIFPDRRYAVLEEDKEIERIHLQCTLNYYGG